MTDERIAELEKKVTEARALEAREDAVMNVFAEIKELSDAINAESDRLNSRITDMEAALETAGAQGVDLWLEQFIKVSDDRAFQIGYQKMNGQWCIVSRREGTSETIPLTRASRSMRLAAIESLDEIPSLIRDRLRAMHAKLCQESTDERGP